MEPLRIGQVEIFPRLVLGPMAGVTDLPFRLLCREQGAGLVCTEMISAKAILYKNKNTAALMRTDPAEHPVALQLFGSEPEIVAEAAVQIEDGDFEIFDLNMGCPVPKVVNNGEGSALLLDPQRAAAIVAAVVRRVKKPVTVKIRRGFAAGEDVAAEVAKVLEDAGAAAITVHGRTRDQYYSGRADWNCIRRVKEAVSIPVIGNGDVDSVGTAARMMRETGCDAVMIARAARGNPWVFRDTGTGYLCPPSIESGSDIPSPCVFAMIDRHLERLLQEKGEYTGLREMRKHIAWYTGGMPNSAAFRRRINTIEELGALREALKDFANATKNNS